jgi:hypothetical protein
LAKGAEGWTTSSNCGNCAMEEANDKNRYKRWTELLWPIGGTLIGLIVVPLAIDQYPDFFHVNRWLLPISVIVVAVCFVIPLLVHENARTLVRKMAATPKIGTAMIFGVAVLLVACFLGASWKLFQFHSRQLNAVLQKERNTAPVPALSTESDPEASATVSTTTIPIAPSDAKTLHGAPSKVKLQQEPAKGPIEQSHGTTESVVTGVLHHGTQEDAQIKVSRTHADISFVGLNIGKPEIGKPLPIKVYLRNNATVTLQVRSASSVVLRETRSGDDSNLIADEYWEKLATTKPAVNMAMVPDIPVWPDMKPPIITEELADVISNRSVVVFVMLILKYPSHGGNTITREVCVWSDIKNADHYTFCARHNI